MIHRGRIQDSIFPGSWALGKRRPGTCSGASAGTPFTRAPEPSQPGSRGPFQSPVGDSRGSQEGRSFSLKATATPGFQPGSRCPKPSHLLSPPLSLRSWEGVRCAGAGQAGREVGRGGQLACNMHGGPPILGPRLDPIHRFPSLVTSRSLPAPVRRQAPQ